MVEPVRNPPVTAAFVDAVVALWVAVTNAGGAVGFLPPVGPPDVRPTAEAALRRVTDGRDDLVAVLDPDGAPVAFAFLVVGVGVHRHLGTVSRLQRHPGRGGARIGAAVLAGVEAAARDRGLDLLVLTVRGGTGREDFYAAHGFVVDARLPGRLDLGGGRVVEEVHMSKPLSAAPRPDPTRPTLHVRRLDPGLPLPTYAHPGDAGLDLRAAEAATLGPGERAAVGTGLAVEIPPGCVGLVHPRSGLAARHGLGVLNSPGTVDSGYRGEVRVVLVNLDPRREVRVERGDRIAQLLVQRVEDVRVVEVADLGPSARGEGGFGSTGR